MMTLTKVFGLSLETFVIILFILVIILAILLAITIRNVIFIKRKYYTLMSGKKGKDLEKILLLRFKEMDKVKSNAKRLNKEHKEVKARISKSISKIGLVKYDAFDDLAGSLSFSLALLDEENSGVVLNSMHSKNGCYTYAKEIIKGESYIPLSDEEKSAIEEAKSVDDEITNIAANDINDGNDDDNFDIYDL